MASRIRKCGESIFQKYQALAKPCTFTAGCSYYISEIGGGGALTDKYLVFGGCIRDPQDTVYHITLIKRNLLYCQVYKIYAYIIQYQLLVLMHMNYDASHCTSIFLTINIHLFIKLFYGYTMSIVYYIDFGFLCLTPTFYASCKENLNEIISSKNWWKPKTVIYMPLK